MRIDKPLKFFLAQSQPDMRKAMAHWLEQKIPGLNVEQVADTADLAEKLKQEKGSNFVLVSSDAKGGPMPGNYHNSTFDSNRQALQEWHARDRDKHNFMATVYSSSVRDSSELDKDGVLNEGLINDSGDDWSKYIQVRKTGTPVVDSFIKIFDWLDSKLGVKYKPEA